STKSGGPQFHGDVYYFNRNEIFNARNFFDQTRRAPLYRKNDVGYTLGGPLFIPGLYERAKSKTFFFWSQEWRIESDPTGYTYNRAVPSLAERQGIFDDICPPGNTGSTVLFSRKKFPDCPAVAVGGVNNSGPLFQAWPGNAVPIQPEAQAILD